ncbi:hypothetical protein CC78DRAFT_472805 [Lojkania enalia]|uniref:Uncharacterized protein n=1 Tax=Lojkania enalia TaxID=147567 RepID=A0A9P4N0G2_9PLEO|nr:hypothetical protein CC78DRAFT_472805 [Didymosphaeria enalia]
MSSHLTVYNFARDIKAVSYSTDFYAELKVNLTPNKVRHVVKELAHIRRPMQSAEAFLYIVQQYPSFRNFKIALIVSQQGRRVVPIIKLQPLEKRKALVFYAQIRNRFILNVDEDYILLGFYTAADPKSAQ